MRKRTEVLKRKIVENGFDLTSQNTRFIISYKDMYFFEVLVSDARDSIVLFELAKAIHSQAGAFKIETYTDFIQRSRSGVTLSQADLLAREISEHLSKLDKACRKI